MCTLDPEPQTPFADLNDARGVGLRHDGADWPRRMEASQPIFLTVNPIFRS
eukprot:SAG22_NODE_19811_length_271_cov_0.848837_1_plen_50_part_10